MAICREQNCVASTELNGLTLIRNEVAMASDKVAELTRKYLAAPPAWGAFPDTGQQLIRPLDCMGGSL
ncbi:hypothetical protein D3C85_996630 [compost metagenome]